MKKAMIGMAVGAMALGASVAPASAGLSDDSLWYWIDDYNSTGAELVLISGLADMLDDCGQGKPQYTVFMPADFILDPVLEALGTSVQELASTPAVVKAIFNDHIVNGGISDDDIENRVNTRLITRSNFVLSLTTDVLDPDAVDYDDIYVNGNVINTYEQACNGWFYELYGFIDSTPQVPTEGLNSLDSPKDGTPGGTNSLPNTL